jgi:hypothetical protein
MRQRLAHEVRVRVVHQGFIAHAEAVIGNLTHEIAAQRHETAVLARDLDTVLQSRSWRLTAPLRWLLQKLKR